MAKEIIISIISGLLIAVGVLGSVLPILPGLPFAYVGLLIYAWVDGFSAVTPTALIVFGVLTLLTVIIDVAAPALGAKGYKASKYGVIGAFIGAFAGIFVFGPFGIILGPFLGGFIGEYLASKNSETALKTAWGSFLGLLVGSVVKLGVGAAMFAYFIYALFK